MFAFEKDAQAAQEQQRQAMIEHDSLYTIFINDERAIKLLALWKAAARQRVPDNGTLQEFVAASVRREWVQTIEDSIERAKRPADFLTT